MATIPKLLPAKLKPPFPQAMSSSPGSKRWILNVVGDTPGIINFHQQSFLHHGLTFHIEAEGWLDDNAARVAIAGLRLWVMQHNSESTTHLFLSLLSERVAIVNEVEFDHQQEPLPGVRVAQRDAVKAGLEGAGGPQTKRPLVILEAGVL